VIGAILDGDRIAPLQQRHTAKRIFERRRDEHGFGGGDTVVKDYVGLCRARVARRSYRWRIRPGHGQVDFGEAVGVIGGVRQKLHFFCMDLPQSDACFVKAYPRETTEAFLDGHVSSFACFGGVPLSLLYDNLKIAVARICGDGKRQPTRAFTELVSHYLFADRFSRPGKGNDKGKVEGLVKYARANFMTPIPEAASYDDLNAMLAARCRARQGDHAGRHATTIGERLVAVAAALRPLPPVALEPCEKRRERVSSTALVRYRCNDYSVPTRYGFQDILVKGFVEEVVILCGGKIVARHPRSYAEGAFGPDPLHYLALIEIKPNALDQAAALQGWDLPEVFQHRRHPLEARMSNKGKREFIQVLRRLEAMSKDVVAHAVTQAIHRGAIGFDAVKLIALARIERRPARLAPGGLSASAKAYGADNTRRRLCGAVGMAPSTDGTMPTGPTSGTPQVLLAHHLKQLKLSTVLREYDKVAREFARDGVDHPRYRLRLIELELIDRERRTVEQRIRAARFPAVKSFDTFEFTAIPGLNKLLVLELSRCEYIVRRENIIALGNSGTGKTHVALALGLAACQKVFTVAFTTAAALVSQRLEARDLASAKLLIIDELGDVALSPTGAELLFETFSQRDERGSTIVTSNVAVRGLDLRTRVRTADRCAAGPAHPSRQYPQHERRQLPPQGIRRPPPRRRHTSRGGAKPGHRHRPRNGRNYPSLTPDAKAALQKAPDRAPFCKHPRRAGNGLLLHRRNGLKSDRRCHLSRRTCRAIRTPASRKPRGEFDLSY